MANLGDVRQAALTMTIIIMALMNNEVNMKRMTMIYDVVESGENGVCDFINLRLLGDAYVCQLVDRLRKVNHASVASGIARIPHAPYYYYIHLQSRLIDAGSTTSKA